MRSLYAAGVRNDLHGAVEALDALGFKTRSGSLDALVQWASLFAFEDTGENMEAAWGKVYWLITEMIRSGVRDGAASLKRTAN